jgi:hypothetical protein
MSQNLTLSVEFDGQTHLISVGTVDALLGRPWITVTATNGNVGFPVFLDSVHVRGGKFSALVLAENRRDVHIDRTFENSLVGVLQCFDEVLALATDEARLDDLHALLRDKMLPVSQSWQRRSLWIRKSKESLQRNVKDSLSQVEFLVRSFEKLLKKDLRKFYRSLDSVGSEILASLDRSLGGSTDSSSWELSRVLFGIALVEILFGICVLPVFIIRESAPSPDPSPVD